MLLIPARIRQIKVEGWREGYKDGTEDARQELREQMNKRLFEAAQRFGYMDSLTSQFFYRSLSNC